MKVIKILFSGYNGRVGKKVIKNLKYTNKFKFIFFKFKKNENKKNKIFFKKSDLVIDFSNRKNSVRVLKLSYLYKKKIIIGTTGFSKKDISLIRKFSKKISIFFETNINENFHIFLNIIKFAVKYLKNNDIELVEFHNKKKKDSPSASSYKILNIIKKKSCNSVRIGDIFGKHSVYLIDNFNEINITHRVLDRNVFVDNLKKIIPYILNRKKGLYNYKNLLVVK